MPQDTGLPEGALRKQDGGDDAAFYAAPRLVTHIDPAATAALTAHYRALLPDGARLLDLMSSWVSHLPPERRFASVVGHGMNAEELAANPRLDRWFVQNLNQDPTLPLEPASLDAALCCVGVQYLQRPFEVFTSLRTGLVAGGLVVISISNRCFPTKAVAIWHALDDDGHAALVGHYLDRAGFTGIRAERLADGTTGDPLIAITGRA